LSPRDHFMEKLESHGLTIEELTAEAMQLLTIELEELYVVLGCQLMGAARPARVAGMVSYQSALTNVIEYHHRLASLPGADFAEWGRGISSMHEDLKQDGMRFLAAVNEELRQGLCSKEILDLANEITSSSMQIIVLIVAAVLKLPRQIEAVCATVAAIVCKSGLTRVYA
jgi:hypothetical protein